MEGLKERRKRLGLSQMSLATKVGVSLLTIQLWEREVSKPNQTNRNTLEKVLEELEGGEEKQGCEKVTKQ